MASGIQGGDPILRPLKWYAALEKSSVRNETGFFIVEGIRAVTQIADTAPDAVDEIVATDEFDIGELDKKFAVRRVTPSQFNTICSTKTPQGILAVVKIPLSCSSDILPEKPGARILLLEHVQDPGNVGTLIRTAAAFDFSGVIVSPMCADPFSPKVVQASAGSLFALWIRRTNLYVNCLKQLQADGYSVVATSTRGTEIQSLNSKNTVIALGNEGCGLSEAILSLADQHIRIPINDKKVESLNVAVTGALLMYSTMP